MRKIIVISTAFLALIIIPSLFSFYYTRKIEKEMKVESVEEFKKAVPLEERRGLRVSDPREYGMVVTDENSGPETQEEWDRLISEKIEQAKAQVSPQDLREIAKKIKEDPRKTENKIKKIDEAIQKYQAMLEAEPDNQEAKERLRRLRMLRSIARALP